MKAPIKARQNAKLGLRLRREWRRGGTSVGVARARDIAGGRNLSLSTIRRMSSFNRHRQHSSPYRKARDGGPTAGYIAWLLWGGTAGVDWARRESKAQSAKNPSSKRTLFWGVAVIGLLTAISAAAKGKDEKKSISP